METERLVLVVLLLVLGCGLAHSRILTKCELADLIRTQAHPRSDKTIKEHTIAKLVCHAERVSEFDTTKVDDITVGQNVWRLYGIFQISNHTACKESTNSHSTTCENLCTDFTDDNVEDDIACAIQLAESIGKVKDMAELVKHHKFMPADCTRKEHTESYLDDCETQT